MVCGAITSRRSNHEYGCALDPQVASERMPPPQYRGTSETAAPVYRYAQAIISHEQPWMGATARNILATLIRPAPPGA